MLYVSFCPDQGELLGFPYAPPAMAAWLRYFYNFDRTEESFQDAGRDAVWLWPIHRPPREPAAWLIFDRLSAQLRMPLCEQAIQLGRLLSGLFPGEPKIMGLLAPLLLQHARAAARPNANRDMVLLEHNGRPLSVLGYVA